MTKRGCEIKLAKIEQAIARKLEKDSSKVFVVQSEEQERDIRFSYEKNEKNEFKNKKDVNVVLIKCY